MKIKDILNVIGGELLSGSYEEDINEIKQNSRNIVKGDTFIAIIGENSDGHKYIHEAIKNGATIAIVSDKNVPIDKIATILVEDTKKALEDITKYKISLGDPVIIGITGSVGKTSCKEMISQILEQKYKVFKTPKNLNTKRGFSLAFSGYEEEPNIIVAEMGMDRFGEISEMSKFLKPSIGIITNIGSSHIGNLGNRDNILKAKLEILDGLKDNGILIINLDNDKLKEFAEIEKARQLKLDSLDIIDKENQSKIKRVNIVGFGKNEEADILIKDIENLEERTRFKIKILDNEEEYTINTFGLHNIYNLAPAIYIAKMFKMTKEEIQEELYNIKNAERRMDKFVTISNMVVYDDSYNASYESIIAAIDTISAKNHYGRKVAIIGDILELGDFSEHYHRKIADGLIKNNYDLVITAGKETVYINEELKNTNIKTYHFKSADEINENIDNILKTDDIILIKASNGMEFNKIADKLRKEQMDPARYI